MKEEKCSEFNIKVVKKIFNDIKDKIKENVNILHNSINNDNEEFLEKFEYKNLLDIVENVEKEEWIIEKNDKTKIYSGGSNIGVCYNGVPEITLYSILKALKTNNNITFFEEKDIHKTSKLLVDFVKEICKLNGYIVKFDIIKYEKFSEVLKVFQDFNILIFVNEEFKYLEFLKNNKNGIKTIYSNYGTIELYLDDKNLKETLLKMDDYVYYNNMNLEIYKDENVEDVVFKINAKLSNNCAVIFTKDKGKAYYFIKHVNSEKIFVNKNPEKDNRFFIKDEELLMEKRIFI